MNTSVNKQVELGWLQIVQQQVGSIRYGVVQVVVHDSRVVQIERTERLRLDRVDGPATSTKVSIISEPPAAGRADLV